MNSGRVGPASAEPPFASSRRPPAGFVRLVVGLTVACGVPASAQTGQHRVQLQSTASPAKIQLSFAADLDADGRLDLVLAHTNADVTPPRRGLSVVHQAPVGFPAVPTQSWTLSPRAAALFHGDFTPAPGVEIGYLAPDGAWVYEQEAPGRWRIAPRKIVHQATFFDTPSADTVVEWMGRTDVDGNGFDDLFVPTNQGVRLYLQDANRRFGSLAALPIAPEHSASVEVVAALDAIPGVTTLTASSAVTLPTVVDVDGDGLLDTLFLQGDRLVYFLQGPPGRFPEAPSDAMQVPVLREFARKDRLELSLARVADVNHDRRADLVVIKRYGSLGDFGSIESMVYFYFARPPVPGSPHPRRCYQMQSPDQQIRLQGFSPQDPDFGDANGDGFPDLLLSQVTTEMFGKILQYGILREIPLYYYLHLYEPDRGRFAPNAIWSRTVAIPTHRIEGGNATWPLAYIRGDADGDRLLDYVEISGKGELTAHLGRRTFHLGGTSWDFGKDDFFLFPLDDNPDDVLIRDLNGDRRADVVLQFDGHVDVVLSR